jgi:hypothetical protein
MYSFEKKSDPLDSLGVGQRSLITKWLDEMNIEYYAINNDFTIDVVNNISMEFYNIKELPEYINFNFVNGWFDCSETGLTSLKGFPKHVTQGVYLSSNNIESLKGLPKLISGNLILTGNSIKFRIKDIHAVSLVKGTIRL